VLTADFDLLEIKPGSRVLDVGCGEGRHALSAYLKPGVDVVGVDLGIQDLQTAAARIGDLSEYDPQGRILFGCADALCLPFADESFDVVICSEVLEHIPNYIAAIAELSRVTKPGGHLCITVPRAWPERICWWLDSQYSKTPGGHIRIFTTSDLRREVERYDLRYEQGHGAHALHTLYWWLRCWRAPNADHSRLVRSYHRLLVWDLMARPWITRALERALNPWLGKSVALYFRRCNRDIQPSPCGVSS